ncbi:hypothetical protein NA57DRAFT_55566 [Rhizodiscina lignyota]|uniref:Uncharacterized protein n=1 Tax=Rhizodiscina lignyota TaxID=1504668 RepID=A0A9P4M6S1_9PEZI|nr:hypothetical protein NA57DRAFT_55566 [Rhizodiscina lignyota]
MASLPCPLPQVQEALEPYIHTRQETRRIREAIAQHFSSSVDSKLYTPLRLACPTPSANINEPPDGLDGLYRRYYDALRANIAARESYAAVKRELDEARDRSIASTVQPEDGHEDRNSVQTYLQLQRQRRQYNKLQIIQDTVRSLNEQAPQTINGDIGAVLKESLGEAPEAPKLILRPGASDAQLDGLIFRLKRELLLTKNTMDEAIRVNVETHEQTKSSPEPSVETQVYALRHARDQLIGWIEGELAKIGEDDSSIIESEKEENNAGELPSSEVAKEQIQTLYDKYVESRKRLVESVDSAVATANAQLSHPTQRSDPSANKKTQQESEGASLRFTDLITCVPNIVQASRTERSLIQQASYLRRQLGVASDDMRVTIQRLAGESYLVPPDASSMYDWARAATAKSNENDGFVREQLLAGRQSIDMVRDSLSKAEAKKLAMQQLRGDV